MHLRFFQLAFVAAVSFLLVHSTIAEPQPLAAPATPTVPPIKPPPTPTIPPIPTPTPPDFIIINPPQPPPSPSPTLTPLPYEPPVNTPSPPPTPDPGSIIADPPVGIQTGPTPKPPLNPDEVIPVIVTFGEGLETRADIVQALMLPVGVPRAKSVTVSLLLPSTYAGQTVKLALYDGGQVGPVAPPGTPVAPSTPPTGGNEALSFGLKAAHDGTVHFNFEAGALLGLYRVGAAVGSNRYLLQFYAVRPRGNTPVGDAISTGPTPALPSPSPTPEKWPTPSD